MLRNNCQRLSLFAAKGLTLRGRERKKKISTQRVVALQISFVLVSHQFVHRLARSLSLSLSFSQSVCNETNRTESLLIQ